MTKPPSVHDKSCRKQEEIQQRGLGYKKTETTSKNNQYKKATMINLSTREENREEFQNYTNIREN